MSQIVPGHGGFEWTVLNSRPFIAKLESELERIFKVKHAVVCNSGTAALHMAYNDSDSALTQALSQFNHVPSDCNSGRNV